MNYGAPCFRQDWQILLLPVTVLGIIYPSVSQACQMADTPGDQIAIALEVSLLSVFDAEGGSIGFGYGRFLSDDKFHGFFPPILFCCPVELVLTELVAGIDTGVSVHTAAIAGMACGNTVFTADRRPRWDLLHKSHYLHQFIPVVLGQTPSSSESVL